MFYYFFLHVFFMSVVFVPTWAPPDAGPAEIKFKYAEKCKGFYSSVVQFNLSAYTVQNRKIVVNISGAYNALLSDDWGLIFNGAVKKNGGWRPNFINFKINGGLCTVIKNAFPKSFNSLAPQVGATRPYKCPLPAGSFDIHIETKVSNMRRVQSALNLGIMPYGEMKLQVNATRLGSIVYCMYMYVEFVPKDNKRPRNG